jgi:hypothetical protein
MNVRSVADMQIALEHQAMQIVGCGSPRRQTKERGAKVLDALAVLTAEIDVASWRKTVERNELERRPEVVRPVGTVLVAGNVIITQKMIGPRQRIP